MNAEFLEKNIELYINFDAKKIYAGQVFRQNLSAESFVGAGVHISGPESSNFPVYYATVAAAAEGDADHPLMAQVFYGGPTALSLGYTDGKLTHCYTGITAFTVVDTKEEVDQPAS